MYVKSNYDIELVRVLLRHTNKYFNGTVILVYRIRVIAAVLTLSAANFIWHKYNIYIKN